MSKGEDKIVDLLNKAHIAFQREKTFSDLKNGKFRYDFYLPDYQGQPVIIEFNGEQHYHFINFFCKNRSDWLKIKENDRRKISYCLAKDIPIYIIPFWEIDNIHCAADLFQSRFLAKTRWKNDEEANNSPLAQKDVLQLSNFHLNKKDKTGGRKSVRKYL